MRGASLFSLPLGKVNKKCSPKTFTPAKMIGKTIMHEDKDGNIVRSEIVRMLKRDSEDTQKRVKFLLETKNGEQTAEEVMEYNDLCDLVEEQLAAIKLWRFKDV
jgi:hypothetical protein